MKYIVMLTVVFVIAPNAFAQDACSQLRSGWREIENERSRLCSEYVGTCLFLETAEKQLNECKGGDCVSDLMLTVTGCAAVIGWDYCNHVANRFTDFQKRRQTIQSLAKERDCLLF